MHPKWTIADETCTHQLTATMHHSGEVFPFPVSALPEGIQKMPGLTESYVSGYVDGKILQPGLTATGELVVNREDRGTGKAYLYSIAKTETDIAFTGPFKPYGERYFNPSEGVDLNAIFGKIDFDSLRSS
jgi:hypothetical protein